MILKKLNQTIVHREMNQPCQFLEFFDGHDIWYLSAIIFFPCLVPLLLIPSMFMLFLSLSLQTFFRHFLGAAGVFFAFLCIFTLDEDVRNQRRDTIRVF